MKILDTSSITDASEFPVKQGTLVFLQAAYAEIVNAVITALLSPSYNPGTVYVLYGCANTGTGSYYNISAGAVFYQGEIFLVPATSFTATGSSVGIFQPNTTQFTVNADPVTFTDMAVRNVHNIRQVLVVQGASGSGIADYTQASFCSFVIPKQLNLTGTGQAAVSGTYPNLNVNVPENGNLCPVLTDGTVHIGDVPGGGASGVTIAITFTNTSGAPTPISTPNYRVEGTLVSQGTPQNDTSTLWTLIDSSRTVNGFSIHLREAISDSQSLSFEYVVFQKNNP